MKIAMILPLLPLHVAALLAASTTDVKPDCTHTMCAEWDCKTWCNCYDQTYDTTYEEYGCTGEDTCYCGEPIKPTSADLELASTPPPTAKKCIDYPGKGCAYYAGEYCPDGKLDPMYMDQFYFLKGSCCASCGRE